MHLSAPARRILAPVLAPTGLLLAICGCGLESPEAPSFQTEIHLPIGNLTYTVAELIESEETIEGDTTGAYPVYLAFEGTLDSIGVADRLGADIAETSLSVDVGELTVEVATTAQAAFTVGEIAPIEIPEGGGMVPVPPFELQPVEIELPPFPEYQEGTIRSGSIEVSIQNDLPVVIEGLVVQLEDVQFGNEIVTFGIPEPIEPGASADRSLDLSGQTVSNTLRVRLLSGSSPGSTAPVFVEESDALVLEAYLSDLKFQEVIAPIPPQTYEKTDSTRIEADIQILSATIAHTTIPLHLENRISVPITVELTLPDLTIDGESWRQSYAMAAGSLEQPAVLATEELLDGNRITFADLETPQLLRYVLRATYDGSRGEMVELSEEMGVSAELGSFRLQLDELTGVIMPQEISIEPTRTDLAIPDDVEGIEFVEAALTLEIVNEVQVPGRLNLTATGTGPDGTVHVQLGGEIAPATPDGPVRTRLEWDEGNSNVLDLVNLRPKEIVASGTVLVGDSTIVSTIASDDRISGRYTIRSPLKVRINDASYRPDPFGIEIEQGARDRIRDEILEAEASLKVRNHLPVGVSVTLQFAADSADVHDRPSVTLDPVHVPAGSLDRSTGRVVESSLTELSVALSAEEIDFFAREQVWAGAAIELDPTGEETIELLTTDTIEIEGLLRFGLQVNPR